MGTDMETSNTNYTIDPLFINERLCISIFGILLIKSIQSLDLTEESSSYKFYKNHLITRFALLFCKDTKVKTLSEALPSPKIGSLFCSTEVFQGNEDVFTSPRVKNKIILPYTYNKEVFIDFSTEHITSYTGKHEQGKMSRMSIIGQIRSIDKNKIILYPLIMGIPSYDKPVYQNSYDVDRAFVDEKFLLYGHSHFEIYPDNIQEFSSCKNVTINHSDEWINYMKQISEDAVKQKFCEILGDKPRKDWGGEQADHFSTVHINGQKKSAAFLLKGPTHFREMTPDMLGKRGDQIYRLAQTTARLLIVQHSHNIGEAVRATLRAFAVPPHDQRYYCLIDGKDTYRILKAYNKL